MASIRRHGWQIEADDVLHFVDDQLICEQPEGFTLMRLQAEGSQDPADGGMRQLCLGDQRQTSTPRSKVGHRTVLTNRVINAFYPCNADAIHTGHCRPSIFRFLSRSISSRLQRHAFCNVADFTGAGIERVKIG